MSLFKINEIKDKAGGVAGHVVQDNSEFAHQIMKIGRRKKEIPGLLENLQMGTIATYATSGAWSMHELLVGILDRIGSCDCVCIATWSITEDPMRIIWHLKKNGMIKKLHFLFGDRIRNHQPRAFQMAEANADSYRLAKTHAKVMTLENKDFAVAVVGSANVTDNRKLEAGTIFFSKEVTAFHRDWIMNVINGDSPFAK